MSKIDQSQKGGGPPSKGRQTTLFQTWGYEGNVSFDSRVSSAQSKESTVQENGDLMDDEDDEALSKALDEDLSIPQTKPTDMQQTSTVPSGTCLETLPGFDIEAGRTWIYPTNMSIRKYQLDIVQSCLYENTLVCLPTGLGKTFIAAVVVYNYYRWYPQGKIVFMAPTKPLVAQQIEACYNIMGIPQSDTCEMTGNVNVNTRERAWNSKRVFFLTPQVMSNDLARGNFPAEQVKLVIVDEAHRAQGDYAYCQVVRELAQAGKMFRVVALTATPGTDLHAVKMVLENLLISHIELRHEDSPDLKEYSHERIVEKHVIPLDEDMKKVQSVYRDCVLDIAIKRLGKHGVLSYRGNTTNPDHYSKWALLQARNEFRQNPPSALASAQKGMLEGDFSNAISLYHAYELLTKHGLRSFYNFLSRSMGEGSTAVNSSREDSPANAGNGKSPGLYINRRLRYELNQIPPFAQMMNDLRHKFRQDCDNMILNTSRPKMDSQFSQPLGKRTSPSKEEFLVGHPKLAKLRDLIVEHFRSKEEQKIPSRAMIFSETRDSVNEINACMRNYRPLIRPMEFVGQAGKAGKRGLTQKEQVEVVRRFKDGNFNTMVCTCVGEEGLDIGEVDLIIFYDVSKSPIRLIQRMGRTGRKRAGKIIVLLSEGKQEQIYNSAIYSKNSIKKALLDKTRLTRCLSVAPRMVPKGLTPTRHLMELKPQSMFTGKKAGPKSKKIINSNSDNTNTLKDQQGNNVTKHFKSISYSEMNGFLGQSDLDYWTSNYKLNEEDATNVPRLVKHQETWCRSRMDMLNGIRHEQEQLNEKKSTQSKVDLSEWILWQDDQQKRHFVSQSSTSKLFENILHEIKNIDGDSTYNHIMQIDDNLSQTNVHDKINYKSRRDMDKNKNNREIFTEDKPINDHKEIYLHPEVHIDPMDSIFEQEDEGNEKCSGDDELEESHSHKTPTRVLDVAESQVDQGEDKDAKFWQKWFPSDQAITKIKIKKPPSVQYMLRNIPEKHLLESFDIKASWNRAASDFSKGIEECLKQSDIPTYAKETTYLAENIQTNYGSQEENLLSRDNQPKSSMKHIKSSISLDKTLITSTPTTNISKRSKMSFISPIMVERTRNSSAKRLDEFRVIPEEEEVQDEVDVISNKCLHQSIFSATQLVSFVNKSTLMLSNTEIDQAKGHPENTKSNISNIYNEEPGNTQNSKNLTQDEIKLVQKMSFQNTELISESLKEAFNVSYDDVVIRGCPIINENKVTYNPIHSPESLFSKESSISRSSPDNENDRYSCNIQHKTIDEVIKCGSMDDEQKQILLYSSFDLMLDDSSTQTKIYSEEAEKPKEFKLPNLEAFETRTRTPSSLRKQRRVKSPVGAVRDAKNLQFGIDCSPVKFPDESSCTEICGTQFILPKHFDPEVFSQLPQDIKEELLQAENATNSVHNNINLHDDADESQILGCVVKGTKRKLLSSSSEEDLVSETDSPLFRHKPKHRLQQTNSLTKDTEYSVSSDKQMKSSDNSKAFHARKFIDMEAVVSDDESHNDSEASDSIIDVYESSFMDDATQKPQDDVDQQAMYLRSIRAPIMVPTSDRAPRKPMRREDIFSQFDDLEEEEYDMNDSFVANSDSIEYESTTDPLDFVEEFEKDSNLRKGANGKIDKRRSKGKKRGRILTKARSSSSDEDQNGSTIGKPKKLLKTPPEKKKMPTEDCSSLQSKNVNSNLQVAVNKLNNLDPITDRSRLLNDTESTSYVNYTAQSVKSAILDHDDPSLSTRSKEVANPHSIMISTLEVQRAQEIVSLLRHTHGVNVVSSKNGIDVGASYMLSPRCAVLRIATQEFCNASHRSDLVLKSQKMNDLFERPWIIVETERKYADCMNPDDVVVTSTHQLFGKTLRTKYIDGVLAQLSQSKIKVLFSETSKETAALILAVLKKEANKGYGLPKGLKLDKRAETQLPFYQSIPGIGLGAALNLVENYSTPKDFIQSAQSTISRKSNIMDASKIKKIQLYLRKSVGSYSSNT